jgi:hypothetical protein
MSKTVVLVVNEEPQILWFTRASSPARELPSFGIHPCGLVRQTESQDIGGAADASPP